MRITNQTIQQRTLQSLQQNLRQVDEAQRRVSTGLRLEKASDDPTGASASMRARGEIRAVEQYRRSIDDATFRGRTEEGVLNQLTDVLSRAHSVAVAQATDTSDAYTRARAKTEIDGLLRHAVQLGNTQFNGGYLFGGVNAATRPYEIVEGALLGFTSTTPTGEHQAEVSAGRRIPTSHDGVQVFEASGVLASLADLSRALGTNDRDGIATALTAVDAAFDQVQDLTVETGSRLNQLDVTRSSLDTVEINLLTLKANIEEVDFEEAVTKLVSHQTTMQAAMLATSRVMGLTLTDYLR